jgi:hypothetical protein
MLLLCTGEEFFLKFLSLKVNLQQLLLTINSDNRGYGERVVLTLDLALFSNKNMRKEKCNQQEIKL